jgi:hypothetical protein
MHSIYTREDFKCRLGQQKKILEAQEEKIPQKNYENIIRFAYEAREHIKDESRYKREPKNYRS